MSYGLTVKNSSDIIQIDQDYSNYILIDSGTIEASSTTVIGAGSDFPWLAYDALYGVSNYVVFFRSDTYNVLFALKSARSTNYTIWASASIILEYRVFVSAATLTSNTNFGLNVYKGDGEIAFTSNASYLNICSSVSLNGGLAPYSREYTLPPTKGIKRWVSLRDTDGGRGTGGVSYSQAVCFKNETTFIVAANGNYTNSSGTSLSIKPYTKLIGEFR